ncbi:MAG: ATP-binding protein [Bacteroidota bacterium]
MKNPFIIFGYDSPEYFCDRKDETERLINACTNGRNVVLTSIRRLGKSVLAKHVQSILKGRKNIVPIYLDIMPTTDFSAFTQLFAKAVFEQSAGITIKSFALIKSLLTRITPVLTVDTTTNQPSIEIKIRNNEEATSTIDDVFRYIKSQKKQLHICIDEFQQISGYPEKNVEAILRANIQNIKNATFIFSGSKKHLLMSMFSDSGRPFYQSSEFFELQKINDESYAEFMIALFHKCNQGLSVLNANEILRKTRTHTYYVQYLCNRLFEQRLKTIKSTDINLTFNKILSDNESVYHSYRNLLTNNQWLLLRAIACEEVVNEPMGSEFMKKYNLHSASSVRNALFSLLEKELIYQENNSYLVSDVFFSEWLKNL